jgi:hypothetical protein
MLARAAPHPAKRVETPDVPATDPDQEALEQWADEGGAIVPPPQPHSP